MEKLVLKGGKMIGYFISNPQSPFYETVIFTQVLTAIQQNPSRFKLSERNDKLRLLSDNVKSLNEAYNRLSILQAVIH